jgi:hypothetical protein
MKDSEKIKYICEWCKPSDIPEKNPTICKIICCEKHGCKTWHYPETREVR